MNFTLKFLFITYPNLKGHSRLKIIEMKWIILLMPYTTLCIHKCKIKMTYLVSISLKVITIFRGLQNYHTAELTSSHRIPWYLA